MTNACQYGFSDQHHEVAFDQGKRKQKGRKVIAVLADHLGDLEKLSLLDIGCSTGFMTEFYGGYFERVIGADIDGPAVEFAASRSKRSNVEFQVEDSLRMTFEDASFDVVTCAHVYEHVPDASQMMSEIYRVLRPGGVCFFSAGNRVRVMEPHYHVPFLSLVPKPMAHVYMRLSGRGREYYETHRSLWGLRKLVRDFEVIDYTRRVIEEPERFEATDMLTSGSKKQKIVLQILDLAYWLCPTYLWLLKKPAL